MAHRFGLLASDYSLFLIAARIGLNGRQLPEATCKRRFDNYADRLYELRHNRNLKHTFI